MTRTTRGFTLIELLIAIAIIGILSSFLLANFVGVRQRARDGVRKSDLRQIQSALELYRSDQGYYPTSLTLTCGSVLTSIGVETPPGTGTVYMRKIPCDPSDNTTKYTYASTGVAILTGMSGNSIIACLENSNDSQKDVPAAICTSNTTWKYTLQNP